MHFCIDFFRILYWPMVVHRTSDGWLGTSIRTQISSWDCSSLTLRTPRMSNLELNLIYNKSVHIAIGTQFTCQGARGVDGFFIYQLIWEIIADDMVWHHNLWRCDVSCHGMTSEWTCVNKSEFRKSCFSNRWPLTFDLIWDIIKRKPCTKF